MIISRNQVNWIDGVTFWDIPVAASTIFGGTSVVLGEKKGLFTLGCGFSDSGVASGAYVLNQSSSQLWGLGGRTTRVVIPTGGLTDLASDGTTFWAIYNTENRAYARAADGGRDVTRDMELGDGNWSAAACLLPPPPAP